MGSGLLLATLLACPAAWAADSPARPALPGFRDDVWLATVKEDGARHGLAALAARIFRTSSGRYYAPEDADRGRILELRLDPAVAARLTDDYARRSDVLLAHELGRAPSGTERRIGLRLGPVDAARLIRANASEPAASAATHLSEGGPELRAMLRSLGRQHTVAEVYRLAAGVDASAPANGAAPAIAAGWHATVARVPAAQRLAPMRGSIAPEPAKAPAVYAWRVHGGAR
jgi:hypothetical protein